MGFLHGKTVVLTGVSSGIGQEIARNVVAEGGTLIAVDRNPQPESHPDVQFVQADLATDHGLVKISEVLEAVGTVDVLVNNAGVIDGFTPVGDLNDALWERILAVNLTAPMKLMRLLIPGMVAAGRGTVVNVASVAGLLGSAGGAAYTAAKHGLVGLTRSTAVLYADDGIQVNAVCPGAVATNLQANMVGDESGWARTRLERYWSRPTALNEPADVAAVIMFLLSPAAKRINGAILPVDGGWTAS